MTSQPFARSRAMIVAPLAVLAALLVLAGPASAHHGRHHHHVADKGDPNGTISSFDQSSGRLTIALADGDSISGIVTDDTRIEYAGGCDGSSHGWGHRHGRRGHGPHGFGWGHWSHDDADTSALVPGAVVDEAFLGLEDGHAVFLKIELEKP